MKKIILLLFMISTTLTYAQSRRAPKMMPILTDGYYVTNRGDTARGKIQTNPDDKTDFYKQFAYLKPRSKRPKVMKPQLVKAYGFDNRHFVMVEYEGEKVFVERLATGRLRFYEFKFNGKVDGYAAVESVHFIKDTFAEGEDADLKDLKKISHKFYKKNLKPYMKDQPMIWSDLDKYNFNEQSVLQAVNEFNKYYASVAN